MILADKIIKLRKQNGWSQEELAEKLNVSRQSVSKWESAISIPDMDKVVKMSKLFGVSTDYLLKDDIEDIEYTNESQEESFRRLSLEQVNEYLTISNQAYNKIGYGVMLCIYAPIILIAIMMFYESNPGIITENTAAAIGLIPLFTFVLIAVVLFINNCMLLSKFNFLEKELFELEYGVQGVVEKRNEEITNEFRRNLVFSIALIFVAVMQLIIGELLFEEVLGDYLVCILLALVGFAVYRLVYYGMVKLSYSKILQIDDYSIQRKQKRHKLDAVATIYWSLMAALYLGISFITFRWDITWIIWPVAGVLYAAIETIFSSK